MARGVTGFYFTNEKSEGMLIVTLTEPGHKSSVITDGLYALRRSLGKSFAPFTLCPSL